MTKTTRNDAAAMLGRRGGEARARALTPAERSEIARKAGRASKGGGWPKGRKRGTSPLKGKPKVAR